MFGEPVKLVKSIQTVITVLAVAWSVLCLETSPITVQVTMEMVQITICVKTDAGPAPGTTVVDLHRTVWNSDPASGTGQKSWLAIWVWYFKGMVHLGVYPKVR